VAARAVLLAVDVTIALRLVLGIAADASALAPAHLMLTAAAASFIYLMLKTQAYTETAAALTTHGNPLAVVPETAYNVQKLGASAMPPKSNIVVLFRSLVPASQPLTGSATSTILLIAVIPLFLVLFASARATPLAAYLSVLSVALTLPLIANVHVAHLKHVGSVFASVKAQIFDATKKLHRA
jgi:hypothetical protein